MISDRQRISHMLKAIERIFEATDCSREDFMVSLLRQDAVAYNFLTRRSSWQDVSGSVPDTSGNTVEAHDRHAKCFDP